MKNKKPTVIILLVLCCLQLFLILFFRREIFLTPYDKEYWKDRYEHSQYQLPLSQRAVGDDGLYAYAGYRIIKGDDPFSINVDKPPTGKYFIGLSILIFNNPAFSGLIFGAGSVILIFFIARQLLKDVIAALFVSLLLLLDPMIASQFWTSLYDIIQLFFLLLNILLLVQLKEKFKSINLLIPFAAGVSLGIFAEIKPPLMLPLLFFFEIIYLIRRRNLFLAAVFTAGLAFGVFMPYLRYVQIHSFIDFFKIHKYMASFYLLSNLKVHYQAIWQVIFLGKFPQINSGQLISVTEWWLMWPIVIASSLIFSFGLIFQKNPSFFWRLLSFIIIFNLITNTFIPAYPRYLILILPFAYLIVTKMLVGLKSKIRTPLFLMVILYGLINSILFLLPRANGTLGVFYHSLARGYFHDIYQENITNGKNLNMTREGFRYLTQNTWQQAEIEAVEIQELDKNILTLGKEGTVKLRLTYKTRNLGKFIEDKTIKLVKKNGQWKVVWDWDILLNGFRPGYSVITNISLGKRGSIIDSNGTVLASDVPGYLISVNPEKMDTQKEQDMLEAISSVSFQSLVGLQNAYLENALPNSFVPLATNFIPLAKKQKQLLESYPGVKLEPYPARLYYELDPLSVFNTLYRECCTRIYSATNYHGEKGLEKEYDRVLSGQSGGETILLNGKKERVRTIIQLPKKDGQNIVI